jgi:hypothetical protein
MAPIITLSPQAELKLTAYAIATGGYPGGLEFSGLGLIEKQGSVFNVIDVDLFGVGSGGYTEFSPERPSKMLEDPRCKLWYHRHPVMGWSGRDEQTATREPLGGPPELVQWSVAIVLTPNGWIGRVDIHVPKSKTFHCPVEPKFASPEVLEQANLWWAGHPELTDLVADLKKEFEALMNAKDGPKNGFYVTEEYDDVDFDVMEGDDGNGRAWCQECGEELGYAGRSTDQCGVVTIDTFQCPNCGEFFVVVDPHSASVMDLEDLQTKPQRQQPAWRQISWWKR